MAVSYFDHTGDIGVDLDAPSLDVLFAEAAVAMVQVVADPDALRPDTAWTLELSAADPDLLLIDWLRELLFRFDTEGFLPATVRAAVTEHDGWHLRAELSGEAAAARRLPIKVLIKAVTYHALEVRRTTNGWAARVIFDI